MKRCKTNTRIILVANTTWYLYNFRFPLIKELLSCGYQVFAASPEDRFVKQLKKNGIEHIDIKISRGGINPFNDILLIFQFLEIYKRYKPDIIQHFTPKPVIYGTLAARLSGVNYIYNMIPGLGYVFTGNGLKKFWLRKVVRFLFQRSLLFSTHIYFQNQDDRNYFIQYNIVNKAKTSIVPGTGVDTKLFSPGKKVKKEGIIFILVARMLWDKGIKEFVEAAYKLKKQYQDIDFWLLGPVYLENPRGILPEQLEEWNKDGVVKYLGMTDNVKSYLNKTDVVVLPSYYREGIPLSLLEAASMGMPIVTTDSVGCREVVEDG
ncbi:N,N'-diacetylbacillosaminyl-diphospho-undecaprenol alpha-1,3-N-acetylgalactosaminyltransferase [subsurface metagenome]